MAYIRKKIVKEKTYYYIVKGVYDNSNSPKQKVILYLGNIEKIIDVYKFYKKYHGSD